MLSNSEKSNNLLKNAKAISLIDALATGRIRYDRGQFTGRFSSSLSGELSDLGAKWDRTNGSWKIPLSKLPTDVKSAIGLSEQRMLKKLSEIEKKISEMVPADIAERLNVAKSFDTTLWRLEKDIQKTVKGITVTPTLTPHMREKIAAEYTKNLQKYIQEFSDKEILRLRKEVKERALSGRRYEELASAIQDSYGVSQRKAKFLARQETSLMMSKFKQVRYQDAGVNQYRWTTVAGTAAHPVRDMHKALDGKVFSWDNPPITSEDGSRNHPGEDFNCRCFARPIIKVR